MEDVAVILLGKCKWGEEGGSALIYYTYTAYTHYIFTEKDVLLSDFVILLAFKMLNKCTVSELFKRNMHS